MRAHESNTAERERHLPREEEKAVSWIDLLGYAASAAVLGTFCMSTMIPLRVLAIASNVLFATFGALAHIYPVLLLHLVLFPINIIRLNQIRHLVQGVRIAHISDPSIEVLLPLMSRRSLKAGETLIRRGEKADRMYYLLKGRMEIVELGKVVESGTLLGEIGIFARNKDRMATVICSTDCDVCELSDSKVKQLYFQDPSFGFALLQLIIGRLLENLKMSQQSEQKIQCPAE
jgi:CRP/FNR family transcriptional regulator, cyclic AMP receptor protein